MRITEQNNFAKQDRLKRYNFVEDLDESLRNLMNEAAEISPETETVFLPRFSNLPENKPLKGKYKACKDVSIETVKLEVEDKGVNTDTVKDEVKKKEKIVKEKQKDISPTKDKGVNTQIMGKIVAESEVYLQNYAALNAFFNSALHQLKIMKTSDHQERRMVNTIEDLFSEGDNFSTEGERLESKGEMALSLAFYTNAASKFKQITLLNNLSSEAMLRAQIRRESCLKKARTMYRRLLVQSAQKSSQNSDMNNLRSSRKTNQVRTERRPCNSCNKSCFWLKDGLCSDCDLRASELHRRTARRNVASRVNGARDIASRVNVPRDFTRPRVPDHHSYRSRRTYEDSESNESSEEEFAPVKSCAICHTHRQQQPSYHPSSYRRRCC